MRPFASILAFSIVVTSSTFAPSVALGLESKPESRSARNSHAASPFALLVAISQEPEISGAFGAAAGSTGLATSFAVKA
jgi:hypothetical protein